MENNKILAEEESVLSVLSTNNLLIPDYQRPYVWTTENVFQLLNDIYESFLSGKLKYRIGSVILYKYLDNNTEELQIVDGQQRITTIIMILRNLYSADTIPTYITNLMNNLKFNHRQSFQHIQENNEYIDNWIKNNLSNIRQRFIEYIETNCEFIKVEVTNQSEAFQMFDSQNGRGKELEAYNLLKAYHIRAMEQDTSGTKIFCDKRWESAAFFKTKKEEPSIDILHQLFVWNLYNIRLWSKKITPTNFNKKQIKEFKGLTLNKNTSIQYPWQNEHLLRFITNKLYTSLLTDALTIKNRFNSGDPQNINPFCSITQEIINGKPFFDYIETYCEIYKRLFLQKNTFQLKEFKDFYRRACEYYDIGLEKRWQSYIRKGDTLLRKQYESLIILIFDKFGETGVNEFYYPIYKWVYAIRVETRNIQESTVNEKQFQHKTIDNKENYLNPFEIIRNAHSLNELNQIQRNIDESKYNNNTLNDKITFHLIWNNKDYCVKEN